jgi:hydroxymethylpyrimidine/phosphomethylpyrimidine kinase
MALTRSEVRCVLAIGGSDSGGGAGLQADLHTLFSHHVHATCAVTCVTAQDTLGVRAVQVVPPELVRAQLTAVLDDFAPEAAKTGFLAGMAALGVVLEFLDRLPPLIVDPVLVDKHGRQIVDDGVVTAYRMQLLPRAVLATPNAAEAALLAGLPVRTPDQVVDAAEVLLAFGLPAVLIKGGRLEGDRSADLFAAAGGTQIWLDTVRVPTTATLGTGDTLSAAIAARLAWGAPLDQAVARAKEYVTLCLHHALEIGRGQGPVGHVLAADLGRSVGSQQP